MEQMSAIRLTMPNFSAFRAKTNQSQTINPLVLVNSIKGYRRHTPTEVEDHLVEHKAFSEPALGWGPPESYQPLVTKIQIFVGCQRDIQGGGEGGNR